MSDPVSSSAVLPVAAETVLVVARLRAGERPRRNRTRRWALGSYRASVLLLRWSVVGSRLAQLAADNRIGRSTAPR